MVDLVLVRHGERAGTRERRYAGSTDVPLTPRGYEQAERLAEWASEASLTAIYSSTLVRARETAAAAARANGLEVRMEPRLVELDFGEGEGLTEGEMAERCRRSTRIPPPIPCRAARTRTTPSSAGWRQCATSPPPTPTGACWSSCTRRSCA